MLLTVDVSEAVVHEAIKEGCDLIVSHHPLLFHGLKHLTGSTPQERCVALAIKHDIAIYSAHTSLDNVLHGVSGRMADKLGLSEYRILIPQAENSHVGLGVIGDLPEAMTMDNWLQHVRDVFGATYVRYTTGRSELIRRVALCGGTGAEFMQQAIAAGADTYLSADMKYHEMQAAAGLIVAVDIDHWISEQFTREIFAEMLQGKVKLQMARADASPIKVL